MKARKWLLVLGSLVGLPIAIVLAIAGVSAAGPWRDLQAVYGTEEAQISASTPAQTFIIRLEGSRAPFSYHNVVSTQITESGIFLRLDLPYGLFVGDLFIPRTAVSDCSVSHWSSGTESNLRIRSPNALISVSDPQETLQSWCR